MNGSVESISIELNVRKKKWLVNCSYSTNNSNICDHVRRLGKSLGTLLTIFDQEFLMGDLNAEEAIFYIKYFCNLYKLENLNKVPTCFKDPGNPKTTDLMLKTQSAVFKTHVHLKLVYLTFIKWQLLSLNHTGKRNNLKSYLRDFGKFSSNDFKTQILRDFSTLHLSNDSPSLDL